VLFRIEYVSVDPVMRVWLSGAKTYQPSLNIGDDMYSFSIATVYQSKNENFKIGDNYFGAL
jgi:NADPH-dependent curcumin reductase CurA